MESVYTVYVCVGTLILCIKNIVRARVKLDQCAESQTDSKYWTFYLEPSWSFLQCTVKPAVENDGSHLNNCVIASFENSCRQNAGNIPSKHSSSSKEVTNETSGT